MKFASRLKQVATNLSSTTLSVGAVVTLGAAATNCRTLAQAISDGAAASDTTAIQVNDLSVPFVFDDGSNWMEAYCTITSTTQITITQIISGTNGTGAVTFAGAMPTVFNAVPGQWLRKVVASTDGVAMTDLTALTPTGTTYDAYVMMMVDPATGTAYKTTVAALKSLFGTVSQSITVNTPSAQTAGTAFTVSGTYSNGTPTALDWSINGGSTWNAATTPTISGGTYSFGGVTVPSANASQTVMVRDHTTLAAGTSASFVVNAVETLTVNTPTTQIVNTAFNVTGTYSNGTPTALDYRFSDDSAGVWTQVASATIASGNFSFSVTPSSTSAGRTISVRDRGNQSITATSGSFVVNSAGTQTIGVTTPATQTAYRPYTLSGTWTGTQPGSLEYSTADNGGAPSAWAALTGATINANGTWTASVTPTLGAASRVMSVRDATTQVSGASNAYVVLTMAQAYQLTNTNAASMVASTTTASASSPDYFGTPTSTIRVNVRDAGGVAPVGVTDTKLFFGIFSESSPSASFNGGVSNGANGCGNVAAHSTMLQTGAAVGANVGTIQPANAMYAWFGTGSPVGALTTGQVVDTKLWVLFKDGTAKAHDNNLGTPIKFSFTVP